MGADGKGARSPSEDWICSLNMRGVCEGLEQRGRSVWTAAWASDQDRPEELLTREPGALVTWGSLNQNGIHSWTQVRLHQFT